MTMDRLNLRPMAPETLAVLDDDNTRQRLVEALAYAGGIRREDVPKVSAEARNRWHILADAVLVELRILSDGLAGQTRQAAVAALDDDKAPARRIDPRDLLAEALARPIDWAVLLGTTDPQEGAPR